MKKRIMTMLLAMMLALEGIGTAPVVVQAEEPVTGDANTNTSMETALELTSGEGAEVTIGEGEVVYYSFTPEEAGWYEFYSESANEDDVRATLLDADGNILKADDDSRNNLQFSITYSLEAENIYYLQVEPATEGSKSIIVNVEKGQFYAYATNEFVSGKYGEAATLEVTAYSAEGTLSYEWSYIDEEMESVLIEDATESSYKVEVTEGVPLSYYCEVTDGIREETCFFTLIVDTGLELEQTNVYVEAQYGETKTLSVSATGGAGELSYQWFQLDEETGSYVLIEGAMESSYEVEVTEGVSPAYACEVTDEMNNMVSCVFTLIVDTGLAAEAEQQSVDISDGGTGSLSVLITGGAEGLNLNYEWYYYDEDTGEYIPIEGATGNSYEITGNRETKKMYRCSVTDGFQTAIVDFDVNVVQVSVKGDFDVTKEMEFSAADFASETEVTYKITSDKDVVYRFYSTGDSDPYIRIWDSSLNELALADDEDDLNFSLRYLLKAEEVYYLVIGVYSGFENETFTVKTEEQNFMAQAKGNADVEVPYGEAVTLEVEAYSADGNLSYQWYRGETAIEGATESSLEITGNEDAFSDYSCEVTSGEETIFVKFLIEIDTGLTVTSEYTGMVPYGDTATLSVHADGGIGEIQYQWYYFDEDTGEFVLIEDATESSYEITGTTDMPLTYKCSVSDVMTQDIYFDVTLDTGLEIEDVNNDVYLENGETATLSVQASGGMGEISYQWYCWAENADGNNPAYLKIADATDSSLEIIARTESQYLCVITDGIVTRNVPFFVMVKNPGEAVKLEEVAGATLAYTTTTYDGSSKSPKVTVKDSGVTLIAGKDYTVEYSNNTAVGTATVTITGTEAYTGTITKTFTITEAAKEPDKEPDKKPDKKPVSIADATVSLSNTGYNYDGKAKTPAVMVKAGNTVLVKDTDYTVSYANNKNIGTATVTITGKGNYTGTLRKTFTIKAKKGTTFTVGSYKYKITGSNTVAFAGLKSSKTRKVTIAKTVKIGGKTFKITSIADKALYKKSKVTGVTIGANVTKIGKSAFEKCSKLKTITIKSTKLKTVGKKAFKGIKSNATIKVPAKKLKAYKKLLKGKGQGSKVKIS